MEHLYTADDKKRGKLIRYYRIKRGLTQADLARKLHVSVNTVWDWEQGRKPSVKHLHQLCQELQIPQEWLELDLADPCNAKNTVRTAATPESFTGDTANIRGSNQPILRRRSPLTKDIGRHVQETASESYCLIKMNKTVP